MLSNACLLLGEPNTDPPKRTRPVLRRPDPPENEFTRLLRNADQVYDAVHFRAEVRSEDAGQDLDTVLLIDYGKPNPAGEPWLDAVPGPILQPQTIADGWRSISIDWLPKEALTGAGCHTVTMLVTHEITRATADGYFCPRDLDDYDTQTWLVVLCENDASACDFSGCLVDEAQPDPGMTAGVYCDTPSSSQKGAP